MAMALSLSRLASPQLRTMFRRRLAGLGAMVLAAAAVALFATLLTYDAHDPSLNTATAQAARNLFGVPGAMTADFLLQGFGAASVLPGMALLAWAWRLGMGNGGGPGSALWRIIALLAALPVLAAALAAGAALLDTRPLWPAAGPGGAAGLIVSADAMAAGRGLMGQAGGAVVWGLLSLLALMLVLLALGLSLAEWGRRSAGPGG